MIIEKTPDRLIPRAETVSWPSGLVSILFLVLWVAVAGKELPEAWADRSWAHAARPLGGIAFGTFLFGDDPSLLRNEIRSSFRAMRRKHG